MDSIAKRIAEIEETAENIVDHALGQKSDIEKRLADEREEFDRTSKNNIDDELARIRQEADDKMNRTLEAEKARHHDVIDNLEREYEDNKEMYVDAVLKRIVNI